MQLSGSTQLVPAGCGALPVPVLIPGPRTSQTPHQGQFPNVCVLSHALCWPRVPLSSSYIGTHIFQELCVLYTCTSTFCFLQQKKDEHLFVNCIKNFFFFCAKRLTARPSNQEKSTGILSNLLFPTARNSKEKGHLCPSLSRVLSP